MPNETHLENQVVNARPTKQILNCHEWHSETDLCREVSNIMVMSTVKWRAEKQRDATTAPLRRSSTCGKTKPRSPSLLIRSGKPCNINEA